MPAVGELAQSTTVQWMVRPFTALPARAPAAAGAHSGRVDRPFMRPAPDLAVRMRWRDVRATADEQCSLLDGPGNQWRDSGLVFTTERAVPSTRVTCSAVIEAAAKTAGVEGAGVHTLRPRRRWTGSSRACRSRPLLICLSAVSLALATLTVAVGCSSTPKYSAPQSFAVRQPVGLSGRWPIGDCCQVALDGRDALGTRSSPSVRSLLLLVSLDRKPLKILCGAVDFAPRVNMSMRDIVDGQLIASSVAPTTRRPARARSKRQAALF